MGCWVLDLQSTNSMSALADVILIRQPNRRDVFDI